MIDRAVPVTTLSHSELTFVWTPTALVFGAAVLLATGVFSFLIWKRNGFSAATGFLESLRLLIVAAVVLTLNQPEWRESRRPDRSPVLAVLHDASASMDTEDVEPGPPDGASSETPRAAAPSRRLVAERLSAPEVWAPLADQFEVVVTPFAAPESGDAGGTGTDLGGALSDLLELHPQLAGVVLISDGDWNSGDPPSRAATRLRIAGVPVFAVPVGSETRLPDLAVSSFDVPTFAIAGKPVRLPFTLSSALPRDHSTRVEVRTPDGEIHSGDLSLPAMGRIQDALIWKPENVGDYELTITLPPATEERDRGNNTLSAPISVRKEELKVLLIETFPRWEYRYLRNALERDPGVEVSCLLFHPGGHGPGGGPSYLDAFPSAELLSSFDVVVLGDVGVAEGQLKVEEAAALRDHVASQAGGLILMPGFRGHQLRLVDSELGDLFPVQLDAAQPRGWGSATPGQFELTELGARSLLTRLDDTENGNAQVWATLPGFQWYAGVVRAKPGAEVLATHSSESNRYGRIPLIATKTYGTGKILFMGTDGAWRWRKGVEDKYHYRFWGQVVRWMAYQRNMASDERMRLFHSPDRPRTGDTLTLNANVMSAGGEPLEAATVVVQIEAPSGRIETLQLQAGGEDQWGLFTGTFTPSESGEHRLTLTCVENGGTLVTAVTVRGTTLERVGDPARLDVLDEIARLTRGELLTTLDPASILGRVATLPEPDAIERRLRLWAHPLWAGSIVLLLVIFWIGRKRVGAV